MSDAVITREQVREFAQETADHILSVERFAATLAPDDPSRQVIQACAQMLDATTQVVLAMCEVLEKSRDVVAAHQIMTTGKGGLTH